ncbi:xanthine dehydrogenase family protein subunit M [Desulfoscipio sp. XC116]|uniref:FAD binding domain-containing protein n=1 Tax=Desulfoscipio sp. XC116 TaxID=3144975 RepID=UPI00325A8751
MVLNFKYEKAVSLEHAVELLQDNKHAYILSGGTNILLKIKHGQLRPGLLISVNGLKSLTEISVKEGYIHIGSCVKINDLLKSDVLEQNVPLLQKAAKEIASPEIRNMATIGGNICSVGANCGACGLPGCKALSGGGVKACKYASSADLITPLMVLDAGLLLVSGQGERRISVQDFISVDRKINLLPGELLKEIYFKEQKIGSWGYSRLSTSKAMGTTVISAAVRLDKDKDNVISRLSLALGGAFAKPVQVSDISQLVKGRPIDNNLIEDITAKAIEQLSYIDNLEMSLSYRKHMTGVLINEAIQQALGVQS